MRVLILYNVAVDIKKGDEKDLICEQEILIIVPLVKEIFLALGFEVETLQTTFSLWEDLKRRKGTFDIVFNLAEAFGGGNNNEILIPMMLEALEIPFTGASAYNMGITLDKVQTKLIALSNGIPTPSFQIFRETSDVKNTEINFPLIVKPTREEASIGIQLNSVVQNFPSLKRQTSEILRLYKQPALIEEFIQGREISVGIIGNGKDCHIFPPLEFLFPDTEICYEKIRSYEYKWGGRQEQMIRAHISDEKESELRKYTEQMYKATECRDYARVDFRMKENGDIFLLEVNYNPGIGPNSHGLNNTLTKMASFEGIPFENLVEQLIMIALRREGVIE